VRRRRLCVLIPSAMLLLPAPASAEVAHTVMPGETLWGIAAANNLTTRTVAVYNGVPEDHHVILGSTLRVPTVEEGAAALQGTAAAPAATTTASTGAPAPQGAYVVRWGDTLSGLAAGAGVSLADMAAMNGLDPAGLLLEGTVLKLPAGAPAPARASEPAPAAHVVPAASPAPTPARLSAGDVQSVAAEHGVSPSLAAAIAWQESGFNNSMVSDANARGVMQVMPGTWDWVQSNLAQRPLDPSSATDNVHAGVLYLKQLLASTGGDENSAIAGYYQGLASVQKQGLYDDTERYVANVQALRSRFGG
jgi:soluble lytic murein transglycosylase-like protein